MNVTVLGKETQEEKECVLIVIHAGFPLERDTGREGERKKEREKRKGCKNPNHLGDNTVKVHTIKRGGVLCLITVSDNVLAFEKNAVGYCVVSNISLSYLQYVCISLYAMLYNIQQCPIIKTKS